MLCVVLMFLFFKQKTAYEMRISDWSSDVCSSDLMLADMLIRDDLPEPARRALELRQEAAKTSTAKIEAMLSRRSADGRMRGSLQYHGAGTGRWPGRGAQLPNLPRSSTEKHDRSEEHTSELQSLMRTSYTAFCLKQ